MRESAAQTAVSNVSQQRLISEEPQLQNLVQVFQRNDDHTCKEEGEVSGTDAVVDQINGVIKQLDLNLSLSATTGSHAGFDLNLEPQEEEPCFHNGNLSVEVPTLSAQPVVSLLEGRLQKAFTVPATALNPCPDGARSHSQSQPQDMLAICNSPLSQLTLTAKGSMLTPPCALPPDPYLSCQLVVAEAVLPDKAGRVPDSDPSKKRKTDVGMQIPPEAKEKQHVLGLDKGKKEKQRHFFGRHVKTQDSEGRTKGNTSSGVPIGSKNSNRQGSGGYPRTDTLDQ